MIMNSNSMTRNLGDIGKVIKPVFKMGGVQFLREKFIRFMDGKFNEWEEYCKENDLDILIEVKTEIEKFRHALRVEAEVTNKMFNRTLVFGRDESLEELANRWFDEYL